MPTKPDLISLQGELFLAKIVSGVPGPLLSVGNMPTLKLKISSDKVDHYDSRYGQRAKDATLYKQTGVALDGELEEVTKENLARVLSGKSVEVASTTITDVVLGTVTSGSMIDLGKRNLSNVTFKDGTDVAIDPTKYTVDATFGTVVFHESVTGSVKWSGTAGAVTRTTIGNDIGNEYKALFKGIDTYSGDKVVVELWRVQFSPETEFDLINQEFSKYSLTGETLADVTKASDPVLSVFGHIERFKVV